MVKVPVDHATTHAATHSSSGPLACSRLPYGPEHRALAEERLRWRSGACPRSPIPPPLTARLARLSHRTKLEPRAAAAVQPHLPERVQGVHGAPPPLAARHAHTAPSRAGAWRAQTGRCGLQPRVRSLGLYPQRGRCLKRRSRVLRGDCDLSSRCTPSALTLAANPTRTVSPPHPPYPPTPPSP